MCRLNAPFVSDVELLLTKYLQNEVELKEVALKAFIKVLLFDVLHLSTVGISNKNRSVLYNYVVTNIFTFKQEHPLETCSEALKDWLIVSVKVKIDELSGEKQRSKSTDSFKPLFKIKIEKDAASGSSVGSNEVSTSNSCENLQPAEEILSNEASENTALNNEKESEAPATPNEDPKEEIQSNVDLPERLIEKDAAPESSIGEGLDEVSTSNEVPEHTEHTFENIPEKEAPVTSEVTSEEENTITNKDKARPRKESLESNSSAGGVSSSVTLLIDRANTSEFQPVVTLNSEECDIELDKINKIREASKTRDSPTEEISEEAPEHTDTVNNEKESETLVISEEIKKQKRKRGRPPKRQRGKPSKVHPTVTSPTASAPIETPMVEIPSSVFQSGQLSPEEEVEVEKKPKPKKKIGPKKIKQRRPTNKHYNIKSFFTSLESHSKKQSSLEIDIVPNKLCNFSFQVDPETYDLSMRLEEVAETQPVTGLTIEKLLYWPGVGVRLSLPEMEIVRYCNANVHRELVPPFVDLAEDVKQGNKTSLYRFYKNKTLQSINHPEKDVELSQIMVLTYLQLVLKALSVTNFPKQDQLREILQSFLSDLSRTNQCYLKTCFSYFCNSHSYYREFRPRSEVDENKLGLVLRETYNPEIVFAITRCNFEADGVVLTNVLTDYFKLILFEENQEAMREFNTMLNKGYSVHCVECKDDQNGQFSGPMKIDLLSEHLGEVCTNELKCVKCSYHDNIDNLSNQQWKHDCIGEGNARF